MPEKKPEWRELTWGERAAIVRAEARGVRRAVGNIQHQPDVDRAVEAVYERARKRLGKNK